MRKISKLLLLVLLLSLLLILPAFAGENGNTGKDIQWQNSVSGQVYGPNAQSVSQKMSALSGSQTPMGTDIWELEPNDYWSVADPIQLGSNVHGTFEYSNDWDCFKLVVTQAGTLRITGTANQSYYSRYFTLGLYSSNNSSSALAWTNTTTNSSGTVQYLEQYVTPGTYYICGRTWDDSTYTYTTYMVNQSYTFTANMGIPVTSVSIDNKITTMRKGDTAQISATVYPTNATNKLKYWSSSNPSVVAVNIASGIVNLNALSTGTARITVRTDDGSYTDYCDITVTDSVILPTSIQINNCSELSQMEMGSTVKVSVTIYPNNVTDKTYNWSNSNPSVISTFVDSNNYLNLTAVGIGSSRLTVTAGSCTAYCDITVTAAAVHPTAVTLNKNTLAMYTGGTETLIATIQPPNSTNMSVNWSSSNPSVATVDASGIVTAVGVGTATITVTTADGGKVDTCVVTVTQQTIHPTSLTLNKTSTTINKGSSETLIATIVPSNATNQTVSWVSSNASVATVDTNGNVTAVGAGSANITAITADGGKTATCSVTVPADAIHPTAISLNKSSTTITKGSSETLVATIAPANATNKAVTWVSSNTSVAAVDANGNVTAVGVGSASITAITVDGNMTATCSVTVNDNNNGNNGNNGNTGNGVTISQIADNTLKIGNDFYSLDSDNLTSDNIGSSLTANYALDFKMNGLWYDIFSISDADLGNPVKALSNATVLSWKNLGKWYKSGSEVVNMVNDSVGGSYTITQVTSLTSSLSINVQGLTNASYYNVIRNGSKLSNSPVSINGKLTSMTQMFSDVSVLKIEFYSDAAGTTLVGTATMSAGNLAITKITVPVGTSGTYSITSVNSFASDFGVNVYNFSSAAYYNVIRTATDGTTLPLSNSAVAISGKIRTLPQMFTDLSSLKVEFYSDAAGTVKVGTAILSSGNLIITKF